VNQATLFDSVVLREIRIVGGHRRVRGDLHQEALAEYCECPRCAPRGFPPSTPGLQARAENKVPSQEISPATTRSAGKDLVRDDSKARADQFANCSYLRYMLVSWERLVPGWE
jgi:hypothetical protein